MHARKLQRHTDPDPSGVRRSRITGRPVPLSGLPLPATVGPHQKIRWRKFKHLPQPYPALTTAIPHGSYTGIRNREVSPPTTTQNMVNPIRHPNLSSFSPSSDRPIRLMDVRGPEFRTTGRPVPLSGLPLPATVGPHQEIGWRKFGYLPQPYPTLTTAIPHGSSTGYWNSEVSPPTTPQKRSTLVQWPEPIRAFPSHSVMLPNSSL
jgi:hypothetical protein